MKRWISFDRTKIVVWAVWAVVRAACPLSFDVSSETDRFHDIGGIAKIVHSVCIASKFA